MSRLLVTAYESIDHSALSAARAHYADMLGEYDTDTDASTDTDPSEAGFPAELTMRIVFADALQYLQLIRFGAVIARYAHEYTDEALIDTLWECLDDTSERRVEAAALEDWRILRCALECLLVQLECGITPIEPIARLYSGSYVTTSSSRSDSSYQTGASPDQYQHNQQRDQQQQQRRRRRQETLVSESPLLIYVPSEAGSEVYPERSARAPAPYDGSWSPITASAYSRHEDPASAVSSSACSITPSESVTNVPSARDRARARHSRRYGSISPVESICSIAPGESASQTGYCHGFRNHYTWNAHPYRTDRYDEGLPSMRYVPGTDYSDAFDEDTSAVDSATLWTDIRSDILRAHALGGSWMVLQMSDPLRYANQVPESSQPSDSSESVYYSAFSQTLSSTPGPSVLDESRLAMGMGSLEDRLGEDATEGERIEFAFDEIDRLIDQWMAAK
ncbi:hypothetical protein G647_03893 [Cladophialophora carrionii CBS 160.54]|uniref:Uncharacterized protein n=1 Tax=Cladophialophora carrionii CBS 160.54 TaxID=1279043 RepID=V9DC98_9EURO|nr:uncharacterized protein G647_03893 [Cladophialophora carrionii CBS 160.54]ETI24524.1 hypothetical protein G647_03893 [Cladophialophora carrionii CBS 160.54]